MKKLLFIIVCLTYSLNSFSQDTGNDSYTIQRLIIYNQEGDILLEKHKNGWMTPALRHNTKISIHNALYDLAATYGLKMSTPKLAGMFVFIPEYKPKSSIRQHYKSNYLEGKLRVPEGKLDAQWFPVNKAIDMMSLPDTKFIFAIRDMTKQLVLYPHTVWGGTFKLWKENDKTQYKIVDAFYPLISKK